MRSYYRLVITLGALLSASCAKPAAFRGPAFGNENHAYAVTYDDAYNQMILGPDWILDNYQRTPARKKGDPDTFTRKVGNEYTSVAKFDLDDDGTYEDTVKLPSYDFLFKNRKTNAQIWVSTIPLSRDLGDKELRVLLSNYVDLASGAGAVVVNFGLGGMTVSGGKRFSARLLEKAEAQLMGQAALAGTIETADIDQLKLSPDARWEKTRVVLVKPEFRFGRGDARFRVLMIAGYSNNPEDFDKQYPEFKRLLSKVHLLTDAQVLALLTQGMQSCARTVKKLSTLVVVVDSVGKAKATSVVNLATTCATKLLQRQGFPATGVARSFSYTYDWSKPLSFAWLSQGAYSEVEPEPVVAPVAPVETVPDVTAPVATPDVD